jgi:hypothetical protein
MNHHRQAVEAALAHGRRSLTPTDEPLVQLVKVLAGQMDEADGEPSTRLAACYLSAVRALARRADAVREPRTTGKLAQLRALSGPKQAS